MEMNHTPKQMAEALVGAVNAIRPPTEPRLRLPEALTLITDHLEASPAPPAPLTADAKLVAGIVKALR